MTKKNLIPYVKTMNCDIETPVTIFRKYVGDEKGFMLESKENGSFSFIGKNPLAYISKRDEIEEYLKMYEVKNETEIPFVGGIVGAFSYEFIDKTYDVEFKNVDELDTPDVSFMVVTELIAYEHKSDKVHLIALGEDSKEGKELAFKAIAKIESEFLDTLYVDVPFVNEKIEFSPSISKEDFMKSVEHCQKLIADGEISQVVLSQRLESETGETPFNIYRKLRMINPSPYLYFFNFGEYQIAGSSPEMLMKSRKGRISTCPIGGTRKRGKTAKDDEAIEAELLSDPKEMIEHDMLVELAKGDMTKVANLSSVEVVKYAYIEKFSHVMHIVSLVEGDKKDDVSEVELLTSFFPAGTLTGAPRKRAIEVIEELETVKRGLYGGSIGYFSFDGDMDFCITIRTIIIKGKKVYVQAGAGIVKESIPENEHKECMNKIRATASALGGLV